MQKFDKINSEGMTLIANQLIRIIEEVLPSKYGGNSTDYQIIEEEDGRGFTRVNINVSPRLGEMNEKDILKTVYDAIGRGNRNSIKSDFYSQADTFQIKRIYPISTEVGKILPLRIAKKRKKNF